MMGVMNSGGAMPSARAASPSDLSPASGASQSGIPIADMVTMTRSQIAVLLRMDREMGYPFRDIASDCSLPEREVRSIVRQFHRQGLTGFGSLYSDDGPGICGSGYWLRKPGWELQAQVRRFFTADERDELTDSYWAELRAQGMSAGTAETACPAQGEARQPGPKDAPKGASHD